MLQGSGEGRKQNTVSPEDTDGLKELIAKLRWAGMDGEADKLCHELETRAPADCLVPGPLETD
jgi:hypothetical protein